MDAIEDAAADDVAKIPDLSREEHNKLINARRRVIESTCEKWFEFGEYVELELDTETGECVVVPVASRDERTV